MHVDVAVELAAAMAAAAEAAVSNPIALQEARTFAEAIWTRYSTKLFTPSDTPHRQFVHLIHELGMDKLALRIADKLKVCLYSQHINHYKQGKAGKECITNVAAKGSNV